MVLDEFARSDRLKKDFEILGEQMKKIAKLSLVAAVAVAGFTTANAQPLEEAIKNVDVSGSVVYRYNDYNDRDLGSQANSSTTNN
jgi:ACT domain-containing protein